MSKMSEEDLRKELEEVKKRFEDWKFRAKTAVEKEREKLIQFTDQNEMLKRQNAELVSELERWKEKDQISTSSGHLSTSPNQFAVMFGFQNALADAKLELLWSKQLLASEVIKIQNDSHINNLTSLASEAVSTLERHKRNVERTMKLATRDQHDTKNELDSLKNTIKELEDQLNVERNSVKQRDLAIATLETQLEEASSSLQRFETDEVTSSNQIQYIEELQRRVNEMEREFSERESIIYETHRDEIDRLLQKHDEEISQIRVSFEDQIRDLSYETTKSVVQSKNTFLSSSEQSDEAYSALLDENVAMKRELDNLRKTIGELQVEITRQKEKLARFEVPPSSSQPGAYFTRGHVDTSQMDSQLMRRKIFDLENQLLTASEQLLKVNQELFEHKANAKEKELAKNIGSPHTMPSDHQQHAYMKAILVKMLCAKSDDVKSSLLPVVSSILKFNNEELKAIYTANPHWIP